MIRTIVTVEPYHWKPDAGQWMHVFVLEHDEEDREIAVNRSITWGTSEFKGCSVKATVALTVKNQIPMLGEVVVTPVHTFEFTDDKMLQKYW